MFLQVRQGEIEITVKRSRFIALARAVENRENAKRLLESIKAEYKDATHVCSAFIADESGDDFGYDDDGEPSGTAGKPIYSALVHSNARLSLIAVVRYFGGIKLGAGGLTRTYRDCAVRVISNIGLMRAERRNVYSVTCGADGYKKAVAFLTKLGCKCEKPVFNDGVTFSASATDGMDLTEALAAIGVKAVLLESRTVAIDR